MNENGSPPDVWTRDRVLEHLADELEGLVPSARLGFERYAIEPRTLWSDRSLDCQGLWALAFARGGVLVFEAGTGSFGIARLRSSDWVDDYGSFGPELGPALESFLRTADA